MPNRNPSNTPPSEKDEWRTLPALYAALDNEFKFRYDFAATDENVLSPQFYFTKESSALDKYLWFNYQQAHGVQPHGFLNPPFSLIGEFLSRANEEIVVAGKDFPDPVIVCLVKANSPETSWWRDNVLDSDGYIRHEVRYLWPRLPYCKPNGEVRKGPEWPSCLIIMRPTPWRYVRWFNWKQYAGVK